MYSQWKNSQSGYNYSAFLNRFFFFFKLRSTQLFFIIKHWVCPEPNSTIFFCEANRNTSKSKTDDETNMYLEPIVQICSSISYKNRIDFLFHSHKICTIIIIIIMVIIIYNDITIKTLICWPPSYLTDKSHSIPFPLLFK